MIAIGGVKYLACAVVAVVFSHMITDVPLLHTVSRIKLLDALTPLTEFTILSAVISMGIGKLLVKKS